MSYFLEKEKMKLVYSLGALTVTVLCAEECHECAATDERW